MKAETAARYASAVIETLRPHFADLSEPVVAEVIQEAIQRHAMDPTPTFEALLDAPGNWRLLPGKYGTGLVRLACYRFNETDANRAHVTRINALLAELI